MQIPTQRIHATLTCLLAFSLPLDRRISPALIALLCLNWLLEWNWKEKVSGYKINKLTLLPFFLYLLYCLGMLYTENIAFGLKDLETKLSLLILPLIYASGAPVKKEEINKVLAYFTLGCGIAVIICLVHSVYLYYDEIQQVKDGTLNDTYINVNFFFSNHLSYFMHPSYFAMYLCLCITYIFSIFFSRGQPNLIQNKLILATIVIIFSITITVLASRMGIIILLLIWLWAIFYSILKKKYYLMGTGAILLVIGSSWALYKNSEILASRINYTLTTLETKKLDKTSSESSAVRLLIWEQAINIIRDSPFTGTGTGDIKDVLMKKYKAEGMTGAFEHKLNAHNQFFQTGIALGIFGLLFMITIPLIPLLVRKCRYHLFIFFSTSILLNFSVESMLEIQVGVIFFSFFFSIFSTALMIPENA